MTAYRTARGRALRHGPLRYGLRRVVPDQTMRMFSACRPFWP